jgi:hypothetical protein
LRYGLLAVAVMAGVMNPLTPTSAEATPGIDAFTNAAGVQVSVNGRLLVNYPSVRLQGVDCPHGGPPSTNCASGEYEENGVARGTVTARPNAQPFAVSVIGLAVTAAHRYCTYPSYTHPSYYCGEPAEASAAVNTLSVTTSAGVNIVVNTVVSRCSVDSIGRPTASTAIADLQISGALLGGVGLTVPVDTTFVPPSESIPVIDGVLVLNEQFFGAGAPFFGPVAVNALHLHTRDGDLIVGHSSCAADLSP